jgi:hypothetical protein
MNLAGKLPAGQKELRQGKVWEQVKAGPLTKETAERPVPEQEERKACFGKLIRASTGILDGQSVQNTGTAREKGMKREEGKRHQRAYRC